MSERMTHEEYFDFVTNNGNIIHEGTSYRFLLLSAGQDIEVDETIRINGRMVALSGKKFNKPIAFAIKE